MALQDPHARRLRAALVHRVGLSKLSAPARPGAQAQTPAGGEQAGLEPTWRGAGGGGAGNRAGAGGREGRSRSREAAPRLTRASGADCSRLAAG